MFDARLCTRREAPSCAGTRPSSPQIDPRSCMPLDQVSVIAVIGTTERTVSSAVSLNRAANAGPSPSARKGSDGMRKRGPGERPPYGVK